MKPRLRSPDRPSRPRWDSLPDVMYRIRAPAGSIEFLSGAFEQVTGWSPDEWLGRPFGELVHPDDLPLALLKYETACRGEHTEPYELRIRTRSGAWVTGEFHSAPFVERHRVVGEQGIARDITARRAAEEALQASEERFRTLFASADDAIFLMDGDTFADVNPKCTEMFGLRDTSEMVGRSPLDYSPPRQPDGRPSADKAREYIRAAREGRPQRFYWQHLRKGGEPFDTEVALNALTLRGKVHLQAIVRDITDRSRAEAALRESEERLRLLSESAFEGIAISEHGKVVMCNAALGAMLGCAPEEMIGRPVLEFVAPEHANVVAEHHRLQSTERYEHVARRKDGSTLRVEVQGRTLPYAGRQLRVSAIRDVTERWWSELMQTAIFRISEAALTALSLQELYGAIHRIVGELMPARNFYIALYDPDRDRITFPYFTDEVDPAPEPKPPGKGLTEYVLRTGRPLLGTPEVFEALVERGDVELIGAPSIDWLGVPLRVGSETIGVLVVQSYTEGERYGEGERALLEFVSGQVAMAIERRRAEDALRESEERLRALETATTEALVLHKDGRILEVNDALLRMFGYERPEDVRGRPVLELSTPETAPRLLEAMEADRETTVEAEGRRRDGTTFTYEMTARPARYRGEAVRMAALRDVTAHRRLEAQLRQVQKLEAIGQLAGGVAHDFNNLLTAILSSGDLLHAALPSGSPHAEDVETIRRAARRGADLTQRLLAFSRQRPMDVGTASLGALAEGFVGMARRVVPEDIEVSVRVEAPATTIKADPVAIEQILMNLVTNARDAMPTGGALTIEVSRRALDEAHHRAYGWGRPGEYVTLTVTDTGTGMDAATQGRIFEPFFTTKPVGQGTGLGMAMVYGLVKQHDGYVHVYSEPGRGTTVRLYFPTVEAGRAEPARAAAPEVRGGMETILLVEDDEAVRGVATRVLRKFGYTVLTASNGYEALDITGGNGRQPDLIVSDVVMPQLSGPHLLAKLREAGPVPRFLFTSGYAARDTADRAQLEPGMPYLPKPWTVAELLQKVREVLDTPAAS